MSSKSPVSELTKAGASLATALLPTGVGSAFALLKGGADALAVYVERLNQRRFEEFCKNAYEGDVSPENAEDLSAEELVVMLRLCLTDAEEEKATLYGCLASSIAAGRVPKELRHPLMTSLSAITFSQAERLRGAYIAREHPLIPSEGSGERGQAEYLTGGGPTGQWDLDKLASVALVRGNALSDIGGRLVAACYQATDLTPEAIGTQAWVSDLALGLYCYEADDRGLVSLAESIGMEARKLGLRITPVMAPKLGQHGHTLRPALPTFVVLVKSEPQRVIEHLDVIMPGRGRSYLPVIVCVGEMEANLKQAFPNGQFVRADRDRLVIAEEVVGKVAAAMTAASRLPAAR